jgi:nucleotidyltransferase substrate binding protein (TIGR01987 family)
MTALDVSLMGKAIAQLRAGVETLGASPDNLLYRDGVIQRFEFTYGLYHKVLLRFLEQTSATPEEIAEMSFASLIRTGGERGLLKSGWDSWQVLREARNITSHTYDVAKAEKVMKIIPDFLIEAEFSMSNSSNVVAESTLRMAEIERMPPVSLSPAEWGIVSEILRRHASDREIWAYGSRARGTRLKRYSDLDLAIEGPPLPHLALSEMVEAFDESSLPFKVDIVEAESLDPEFRTRIKADKVVLLAPE